jgi:hypothetical protein
MIGTLFTRGYVSGASVMVGVNEVMVNASYDTFPPPRRNNYNPYACSIVLADAASLVKVTARLRKTLCHSALLFRARSATLLCTPDQSNHSWGLVMVKK